MEEKVTSVERVLERAHLAWWLAEAIHALAEFLLRYL